MTDPTPPEPGIPPVEPTPAAVAPSAPIAGTPDVTPIAVPIAPTAAIPPGYYDDGQGRQRWYDGIAWTGSYKPADVVPKPPKVKKFVPRTVFWWVTAAALVLGIIIGSAGGRGGGSSDAALKKTLATDKATISELQSKSDDVDKRETDVAARETAVQDREDAVGTAEKTAASNTFSGSGTYLVGTDIKPGTYRSKDNDGCYWARLKGLSGSLGDILANDNVNGPTIVTIKKTDKAFETNRCGDWTKIG